MLRRFPTSSREVAGALVVLGVFFLVRAAYYRLMSRMTRSWKPVTAVITHSQVADRQFSTRSGQVTKYRPDITYVYTLGGKDHAGTQVYPGGDEWQRSQTPATEVVNRFQPGARVCAHYNPAKPDHAVLIQDTRNVAFRDMMFAVAALLGALIMSKIDFSF